MSKTIGNFIASGLAGVAGHYIGKTIDIKNPKHLIGLGVGAVSVGLLMKKVTGASLMNMALCFSGGIFSNNEQVKDFFTSILQQNSQTPSQSASGNKADT